VWNIGSIALSTTVWNMLTSLHGSENAGYNSSSRQGMPSASSQRMVPWPNSSDRDALDSPPPGPAKQWSTDVRVGER